MAGKAEIGGYVAPKFDGNNPQQWVFNIQAYLNSYKVPENQRLRVVELNLEGGALEWYRWMKRNNLVHDWHDLLQKVKACFEPSEFVHYQEEFSKLKQKGSVAEFQAEFVGLVNNVVIGISESLLIEFFVEGLKCNLKREVQLAKPRTLLEAFALATYYEDVSRIMARWVELSNHPKLPEPNKGLPKRRLSMAEMQEKRSKGLCYNCDRRFNPKHQCPCTEKIEVL